MTFDTRTVEYYNITVADQVADGSRLLSQLARAGVDLLAYQAVPVGPRSTRFTLFPTEGSKLTEGARKAGSEVDGPHSALLVKGGEEPGALAGIFEQLAQANIPVRESCGIADINGGYGVVLYLEPENGERAVAALER